MYLNLKKVNITIILLQKYIFLFFVELAAAGIRIIALQLKNDFATSYTSFYYHVYPMEESSRSLYYVHLNFSWIGSNPIKNLSIDLATSNPQLLFILFECQFLRSARPGFLHFTNTCFTREFISFIHYHIISMKVATCYLHLKKFKFNCYKKHEKISFYNKEKLLFCIISYEILL